MPQRGRRPIPTATKIAENYRADRINGFEPEPVGPLGGPPGELDEVGRAAWDRIAREVVALGAKSSDADMLLMLCQTISLREQVRQAIKPGEVLIMAGSGGMKANPAIPMLARLDRTIVDTLGKFGMSPVDRARVSAPPPPDPADEAMNEFLG